MTRIRLFMRAAPFLLMLLLPMGAFAATPEKPVARVDTITASGGDGTLVIHVTGAVAGGGWKGVHLRPVRPHIPPGVYVVELVGTPPPDGTPVIEGLLPVSAELTVHGLRNKMGAVRGSSQGNEITTQLLN